MAENSCTCTDNAEWCPVHTFPAPVEEPDGEPPAPLTPDTIIHWVTWGANPNAHGTFEPVKFSELTRHDCKTLAWNASRKRWEGGYPF